MASCWSAFSLVLLLVAPAWGQDPPMGEGDDFQVDTYTFSNRGEPGDVRGWSSSSP